MLGQSIKESFRPNGSLFRTIVGSCFGLLLGIAFLRFSPLLVLGALAAVLYIYFTLKRPEFAILGILIATSSIVFENQLPLIPMGGASLIFPDILLLGSLGLVILRWLVEPEFKIVRTPLDLPLLVFYGVTLLSTFIAINQSSVDVVDARRWIRVISYYLTFFIVTNLVRERRQLDLLLNGLFLLATIVAAAMAVQFLLGGSVPFLPGRVETLQTLGTMYEDVARISPPGLSILVVSFVAMLCILALEKSKPSSWLKFLQCGLMGMALVFTFLRSYWAVLILAFFLLAYLLRGADRQRLVGWGLVVLCPAVVILLVVFSDPNSRAAKLVGASMDRLSTLGNSGTFQGQYDTFNWRMIENRYAIPAIASHALIGMGMGFTYRPWDHRLDMPDPSASTYDFRKHIHNGHFWILLQSGLVGYLGFLWLSFAFLFRGFRHWRSLADDRLRGVVLGFTLAYLAILIAAVVNSTFMQWRWVPVIGLMMGVNEVILMRFRKEQSAV